MESARSGWRGIASSSARWRSRKSNPSTPKGKTSEPGSLLEAEITGNLEHPGIVPVYSLGRNAEGRPYYAMRFIRGESLSVAIRRFHEKIHGEARDGREGGSPSMWGIEFRQLLGRFLDVCDAMDYAHSRNVIHRDLKPANIMLGRYGETLVVDWGLAKVLGKNGRDPGPARWRIRAGSGGRDSHIFGRDPAGHDDRHSVLHESRTGPRRHRPARSRQRRLQPGATLYELLTGEVAFPGDKAGK